MKDYVDQVIKAQAGDNDAMAVLLQAFKPKVIAICREYFLLGADFDDLIQEGMIGLYRAINAFDTTKTNLSSFASVCIHHHLQTAVKTANRKKNSPLNSYVPINFEDSDDEDKPANVVIVDDGSDVEKNYIHREMQILAISKVKNILNEQQFKLLKMFLRGDSYIQMSNACNLTTKQVDNMLQAIKKKLRTIKGEL